MSAIDEHTNYELTRREIQNIIFKRFIRNGSFVADNGKEKTLFWISAQPTKTEKKNERQRFIRFYDKLLKDG